MKAETPQQDRSALFQRAVALHHAGQFAEAEALYQAILRVQKHHFDATHRLAMLRHQIGDTQRGLHLIERALKTHPNSAAALNSRGLMLASLGRHQDAIASFDQALSADPAFGLALINRGKVQAMLERPMEALASYDRALSLHPDDSAAHYARGLLLQKLGRAADALESYESALQFRPEFPEALNNRATILEQLGRADDALADYARATVLHPGFAEAWNNRGFVLDRVGRHTEALASFRRAIAVRPDFSGARLNLAELLYVEGQRTEALAQIAHCLAHDASDMKARICRAIYQLPVLYEREAEIAERRAAYEAELRALSAEVEADPQPGRFADAVAVSQPFFLAYQGEPDRDLQCLYGGIMSRIMADRYPPAPLPPPPAPGERIRIGFASGYFCQHPVWRTALQGWVTQLDRARFEVIGYHTGARRDAETEIAARACDRFVQGPLSASGWRAKILADAPHVLIYPEVGQDRMAAILAAQRLAPVQCNSWGHPDTSGLPTLDYFLSSEEMEPDDADAHYTERLVRLPGLGTYYEPRTVRPADVPTGLREDVPRFWCGQSLYKYLPQYDEVFPRIAREVGLCQFAFITHPVGTHATEMFRARLDRAFAAFGLNAAEYVVILPRLSGDQFAAAIGRCDIILDSIGWAGFNSTLESFAHLRPIVAYHGRLMRGRHTSAILRVMGLADAVALTIDDYVAIAVALARDPSQREAMCRRLESARHKAVRTREPITALEAFLERAVFE